MPSKIVLVFGTLDSERACAVCYANKRRFGTLIDPNGHKWVICSDCINSLWKERQALNIEAEQTEKEREVLDRVFAKLRDQILGEE